MKKEIPDAIDGTPPVDERPFADVAVIIPCHNYGRFLRRAIDSILSQTVRPWEIMVVDDASTDDTKDIALSYADRRVTYIRVENLDLAATRNSGALATFASFLLFLDADDYLQNDYIERCLEPFTNHRIGFVYGDVQEFGESTEFRRSLDFDPVLLSYSNYICSHALIRRHAFDCVGGYRSIPHAMEDWDFYRLLVSAHYMGKRADTRSFYYKHKDSMLEKHLQSPYFTYRNDAALLFHPITIFTVFTGISAVFPQYLKALRALRFDPTMIDLCWFDASADPAFGALLRSEIGRLPFRSVRLINGTAVTDSSLQAHRSPFIAKRNPEFQEQMKAIRPYNMMIRECTTDYILTLGDDIALRSNTLQKLLGVMQLNTTAVIAPVRSTSAPSFEVWKRNKNSTIDSATEPRSGIEEVDGAGLGCTLFRTAHLKAVAPPISHCFDAGLPFDSCMFLRLRGYDSVLCNWDLEQERIGS